MPPMNFDLTEVQSAIEATAGTLAAATRLMPFISGSYTPGIDFKTLEEVRGVMANFDDIKTRQMSTLELTQELDYENCLPALLCSMVSVTPTGTQDPYTWTFKPGINAPRTIATATFEIALTDGTNFYRRRFGFARCTAISIEVSEGTAQLTTTWMGRAAQPLPTPAAVASLPRTIIPVSLFKVSIDDDWASLGTSDNDDVRSFTFAPDPAISAGYTLQGRADLDQTKYYLGRMAGAVDLVYDHDDDGAEELAHFEAEDKRFLRLYAESAANRSMQIDVCGFYNETPDVLGQDGRQHTLGMNAQIRADDQTPANIVAVTIENGVAAW